jgi:chemotaxis protein CheZ
MSSTTPLPAPGTRHPENRPDVHHTIGLLTRQLHDALSGLGLIGKVQYLAGALPDAQNRLAYIARLTGEAAVKVLDRVDLAKLQNATIANASRQLSDHLGGNEGAGLDKGEVLRLLTDVDQASQAIDVQLTEIMMAQDFHDLTGQVIAQVVGLAASIEEQLLHLLVQTAPQDAGAKDTKAATPTEVNKPLLAGPVIQSNGLSGVVTSQSEVDDLLASMGF